MIENLFLAGLSAAIPLLFATIGEIYCEKSGNLNLGVEGNMMLGAAVAFIVGFNTDNAYLAITSGALAGAMGNVIYSLLTITFRTNQVVTGLALSIFGEGMASFIGKEYVGKPMSEGVKSVFGKISIPVLSDIPVINVFFNQDILVYLAYIVTIFSYFYFSKTAKGLNLRAIGENPSAADAAGVQVTKYKYVHIIFGGALMGLGGAYLSLVKVPVWQEGVTGGKGWIAVALVIFASWSSIKAFFASILFGLLDILGLRLQSVGIMISQYLIEILPYLTTLIVLVITDITDSSKGKSPAALSQPYFRENR